MSVIETPRLVLRYWKEADYEPFVALNQNPQVMKYFPDILTKEETYRLIERIVAHFKNWKYGFYATEMNYPAAS